MSIFFGLFIWVSIMVSVEQVIQRNGQQVTLNEWAFGQTLALSLSLLSIIQAVSTWRKHWPSIRKAEGNIAKRVLC
jgi:hypothetical protein